MPEPLSILEVLPQEYEVLRPNIRLKANDERTLFEQVHQQEEPLTALCFSGGGIRSATFALGVIQGLADQGVLNTFDYLSTVSGGGYIGGWLTAWKQREGGIEKVIPQLRRDAPAAPEGGSDPIQHLREYNNYLSPKAGALSADTWTLIATVTRNIFLNWMVFVPLLLAALVAPAPAVVVREAGRNVRRVLWQIPPRESGGPVASYTRYQCALIRDGDLQHAQVPARRGREKPHGNGLPEVLSGPVDRRHGRVYH